MKRAETDRDHSSINRYTQTDKGRGGLTGRRTLPGGTGRSDRLTGRPALWALMASWYCCVRETGERLDGSGPAQTARGISTLSLPPSTAAAVANARARAAAHGQKVRGIYWSSEGADEPVSVCYHHKHPSLSASRHVCSPRIFLSSVYSLVSLSQQENKGFVKGLN